MASKSYPIWNNITACIYKASKSYGVREKGKADKKYGQTFELQDELPGLFGL